MMKTPEHTWGTPGIAGWGGGDSYNKTIFTSKLATDNYMNAASSWAEQRIYNALAVAALEEAGHPLASEMRRRYDSVATVTVPDFDSNRRWKAIEGTTMVEGKYFNLTFDSNTGAIVGLQQMVTSSSSGSSSHSGGAAIQWASKDSPLGALSYQTLNESDWKPFTYDYINGHTESGGFCKKGSNNFTVSKHWLPILQNIFVPVVGAEDDNDDDVGGDTVIVHMKMPSDAINKYGGCFTDAYLNITGVSSNELSIELITLGKTPTMVGESTMLTFAPAPKLLTSKAWQLDKIGTPVDPEDVIDGGNQYNHGTWNGGAIVTTQNGATMQIVSLDAPNMCPQTPNFPFGNPLPAGSNGLKQLKTGSIFGMGVNGKNKDFF